MSKNHSTCSELHRNVPWGESKGLLTATQWGNEQLLYVYPLSRVLALTALGTGQKGRDSDSRVIQNQQRPSTQNSHHTLQGTTHRLPFFSFFLIFWPRHMACKILGPHPRIELMPSTSNVLTTGLPGKPLANVFFKGPESKYFRLHSHCHIFFSFFLQVFNKKQAWPVCGLLSLGLSKLSGCLLVTSHQQDIKFTKSGSRSSCLSQNYDLIIHKHGFYTTGVLYPVYLCLYPLNETMIFPVRNWQCPFRLNSNAAFSRKSSLTPEAHPSIPWTSNTLWDTRLSMYGNTAYDNSYSPPPTFYVLTNTSTIIISLKL